MSSLLTFEAETDPLLRALDDLRRNRTVRFRSRLTEAVAESVLQAVIERQPVETGRTKRAWEAAFSELRGGGGAGEGSAESFESRDTTEYAIVNRVEYVVFVEDGTRKMRPRLMVKRSLAEAPAFIARDAPPIFAEEIG